MRIFKSIGFKFVLGILVLGFSMSCSDDDGNNKTNTVAPVVTGDAPDGDDTSYTTTGVAPVVTGDAPDGDDTRNGFDDVADLEECTAAQKDELDRALDTENPAAGGIAGMNDPLSSQAVQFCASTEDEEAFRAISDKGLEEGDNRVGCKWTFQNTVLDTEEVYYCRAVADVDATEDTDVVAVDEPASWGDLPHNVKAYVQKQTCSGGKVLNSDLYVNFEDAELAAPVTRIYCNDEGTPCSEFASNTEGVSFGTSRYGMGNIGSVRFGIDDVVTDFNVELITKAKVTDDQNEAQEVSQIDSSITVNFPNNPTCGVDGIGSNVECDENPCVDAPESHVCTFQYSICSVVRTSCSDGYTNTTANETGEQFMQVYCTK